MPPVELGLGNEDMIFTVDTKRLVDALTSLSSNKIFRPKIAPFSQVHLQALENGDVVLTGNNGDTSQFIYLRARVEVPGEACVEAKPLLAYVKGLPKGSEAVFSLQDGKLIARDGTSKSIFGTSDISGFPVLVSKFEEKKAFDLEPAELLLAFVQTAAAISNEDRHHCLNGVYITPVAEGVDSLLRFVATDGHRMHITAIQAPLHGLEHIISGVIIPENAVASAMKLLRRAEKVRVHICPERTEFHLSYHDGHFVILTTKNIEGVFPDYERFIPVDRRVKAAVDRAQLESIAAEMGKRTRKALSLNFAKGKLTVSVKSDDFVGEETIDCTYEGPNAEVGYNGLYISECLKALEGEHPSDEVQFEWTSREDMPVGPVVITACYGGRVQTLLMPVRLV